MTEVLAMLSAEIGIARYSRWLTVDQSMINSFAEATLDDQYIHVDPVRAATTPFGGTIAHGFLTLSLLSHLAGSCGQPRIPTLRMSVNYGFDRLRFVTPVRAGSRIRAVMTLIDVAAKGPAQIRQTHDVLVEMEDANSPALIATWLSQLFIEPPFSKE